MSSGQAWAAEQNEIYDDEYIPLCRKLSLEPYHRHREWRSHFERIKWACVHTKKEDLPPHLLPFHDEPVWRQLEDRIREIVTLTEENNKLRETLKKYGVGVSTQGLTSAELAAMDPVPPGFRDALNEAIRKFDADPESGNV